MLIPPFMDRGVVPLAQQDQIVKVGETAVGPGHPVMSLQMARLVAPGEAAHPIPDHQRSPQRPRHQAASAAKGQDVAVLIEDCA